MPIAESFASLPATIQWHAAAAGAAVLLGPLALRARQGSPLHRGAGYLWITLMLVAANTSLFIRDFRLPNLAGYTPIHLLTLFSLVGLAVAVAAVLRRNIRVHRQAMWRVCLGACVAAGLFTLLPGRFFGHLLWHDLLGLV